MTKTILKTLAAFAAISGAVALSSCGTTPGDRASPSRTRKARRAAGFPNSFFPLR
jgi:hypothetical protein